MSLRAVFRAAHSCFSAGVVSSSSSDRRSDVDNSSLYSMALLLPQSDRSSFMQDVNANDIADNNSATRHRAGENILSVCFIIIHCIFFVLSSFFSLYRTCRRLTVIRKRFPVVDGSPTKGCRPGFYNISSKSYLTCSTSKERTMRIASTFLFNVNIKNNTVFPLKVYS